MAEIAPTIRDGQGWRDKRWTLDATGDSALTAGYDVTAIIDVDTANSDTVKIQVSMDGTTYYDWQSYTADAVGVAIPRFPYVQVTFGQASKVLLYGVRHG